MAVLIHSSQISGHCDLSDEFYSILILILKLT